jgi:serine/threonine protein kinase
MLPEGFTLHFDGFGTVELGPSFGAGGGARLHRATDGEGQLWAVKVHHGSKSEERTWRARNEACLLVSEDEGLLAPLACTVFEYMGAWYTSLLMHLFPHEELAHHLSLEDQRVAEQRLQISRKLVEGLVNLHNQGIVHGDLSSSNVLVDPDLPRVMIIDFESAHIHQQGLPPEPWDREEYRAPEVLHYGIEALGFHSDVWACGLILLQLFDQAAWRCVQAQHGWLSIFRARQEAGEDAGGPLVTALGPGVEPEIGRIVMDMLCIDPNRRPSAEAILARLVKLTWECD